MSFCKKMLTITLMTISFNGMAASNFPHGCEVSGFGFADNFLILNHNANQTFYLIQNRGTALVELQRYENREAFMTPPLTAKLDPNNWGAFASDVENYFQCFVKGNENPVKIDCRDVLDVCQYPRVKFALSNMGNYWVSANKTQTDVINEAVKKGIHLRW